MFKIISNNVIIDVVTELIYVTLVDGSVCYKRGKERSLGLVSSDGEHLWRLEGAPPLPGEEAVVSVAEISEEEYLDLYNRLHPVTGEEPEPVVDEALLLTARYAKNAKIEEMRRACEAAITGGVDVTYNDTTRHYSMELTDQLNLLALIDSIEQGLTQIPYHSDGEACRYYTPEEFGTVVAAANAHKTYHTTYYNSLKAYIESVETLDKLDEITYGMNVPVEYQSDVLKELLAGM